MQKEMIFVSYSRQDSTFVDKLVDDLILRGFRIWRDTKNLAPGNPNWEKAIRNAIEDAAAVVLIASVSALASDNVQGELTLAKDSKCPIYPIWAAGEKWIHCVPLDMVNAQYVDGRDTKYAIGIEQLTQALKELLDSSGGSITIGLPAHDTLTFNYAQFHDFDDLLNKVWLFNLSTWYEAFTYGRDWVLGNVKTRQLALPWEWLTTPRNQALSAGNPNWDRGAIANYGIESNAYWGVWDLSKIVVMGVALNSTTLIQQLKSENSLYELTKLYDENRVSLKSFDQVDPAAYRYKSFIGLIGPLGSVLIYKITQYADGRSFHFFHPPEKAILVEVD